MAGLRWVWSRCSQGYTHTHTRTHTAGNRSFWASQLPVGYQRVVLASRLAQTHVLTSYFFAWQSQRSALCHGGAVVRFRALACGAWTTAAKLVIVVEVASEAWEGRRERVSVRRGGVNVWNATVRAQTRTFWNMCTLLTILVAQSAALTCPLGFRSPTGPPEDVKSRASSSSTGNQSERAYGVIVELTLGEVLGRCVWVCVGWGGRPPRGL